MKEDFNPAPLQLLSISYDIETCETLTSHFNPDEKLIDHSRRNKETKNPRNLWSLPPDFKIAHFFPHGFKVTFAGESKSFTSEDEYVVQPGIPVGDVDEPCVSKEFFLSLQNIA
ncbi:uncharacterized protein LOC113338028 isoform X2 [Papaver somniferum]|uniref:uncharacterized protein LOC113338028 isoform X2 n=1 Tax=Papaver somniferum TaxID=3469 RepID=UPI000E6F9348|nr:uncharacterized protein LOC113338028 isoform X2 [Papaver somniferum]